MKYTEEQQEVIDFLREQLGPNGHNAIVSGAGGTGKAIPNDTIIPTPEGFRYFGDIKVGDFVFGRNGKPTKVIGVYPQGIRPCYKIETSDGRSARCDENHLWAVCSRKTKKINNILTLKDMLKDYQSKDNRGYAVNKYKLPQAAMVEYPTKQFIIDPYIIGCFLGDGCCLDKYLAISSADKELIEELEMKIGHKAIKRSNNNYSWDFKPLTPKTFFKDYPELLNYSYDKSIPKEYLLGDINQRLSLLAGLFDTDGSPRKEKNGVRFTSTSKILCEQVRQLLLSLGCHCGTISEDKRQDKYTNSCFYLTAQGPKELIKQMFHLKRKIDIVELSPPSRTNFSLLTINNIEKVKDCEMSCIKVASSDHLFLTEDYIVTHNTTMLCQFVYELLLEGKTVALTAATGKATGVLRQKIHQTLSENKMQIPKKEILFIETISKMTKESKVLGLTESGDTIYTNTWRNPKGFNYDILFIDELSMVPEFISIWWQMTKARVFGFGDSKQLPEVHTAETQKEISGFRHDLKLPDTSYTTGYGVKVLDKLAHKTLYKVLRSDNEIALLCGEMRDFTQTKQQMVQRFKSWAAKTENIQYSTDIKDLETGADWQIISYTNMMAHKINEQLCIGKNYPDLKDKIILTTNINPLKIYNGDVMFFHEFLTKLGNHNRHLKRKIYVCLKWQNKMPRKDGNAIEKEFFMNYVLFKKDIEVTNRRRLDALPDIIRQSGFATGIVNDYIGEVRVLRDKENDPNKCFSSIVEKFYDMDRDMAKLIMENSEPLPRLYMANADLGFCITTHKSQASEWEKVCYIMERYDKPLIYTGISRAKKIVKIIDLTK